MIARAKLLETRAVFLGAYFAAIEKLKANREQNVSMEHLRWENVAAGGLATFTGANMLPRNYY